MLEKLILIIDKRLEMPAKYKKILKHRGFKVFCAKDISKSIKIINSFEPDLILISDSIDEDLLSAIRKLKILSINVRPAIISLSKSTHIQDKIDALQAGADEFVSEPVNVDEFEAIINAHIRRNFENNINEKTGFFNSKVSFKIMKRTIEACEAFSMILVDINNFEFYREIYGEIAASNMLKTYAAIINSTIDENDYAGQIKEDDFLIITNPLKAEKIAQFLTFAFDSVIEKFYSSIDSKRGFILTQGNDIAGSKVSLVSTNIGIISNQYKKYSNIAHVLSSLISTHKLSKMKIYSNYVCERPELMAENSVSPRKNNKKVLILEKDEALRLLLSTTCEIKGLEPILIDNIKNIFNDVPALILLDAGLTEELKGLNLCKKIRKNEKFKNTKIILTSVYHDKEKIFGAGADIYFPKPYNLSDLFMWIEKLVKEYNY